MDCAETTVRLKIYLLIKKVGNHNNNHNSENICTKIEKVVFNTSGNIIATQRTLEVTF